MKVQPLMDRVLVKRAVGAERTDAGLWIPDSAREKMGEGTVIEVGPGRVKLPPIVDVSKLTLEEAPTLLVALAAAFNATPIPPAVAVGDRVLFSVAAGTPLEVNREDFVLLREEDILARITDVGPGEEADVKGVAPPEA